MNNVLMFKSYKVFQSFSCLSVLCKLTLKNSFTEGLSVLNTNNLFFKLYKWFFKKIFS